MPTDKRCSTCGERLPLTEFYRSLGSPDGYQWICKACSKSSAQRRRAALAAGRMVYSKPLLLTPPINPPHYMDDEPTAPGVPPPSLTDGKPDWDAYNGQASSSPLAPQGAVEWPSVGLARRLLAIGDIHAPRHHPSTVDFLAALKAEFQPDVVVQVGDETDFHGLSFYERNPNLAGASEELRDARGVIRKLESLWPQMWLIESNHGSLLYRRAVASGIPSEMVRGYNEVLQVGAGWRWVHELDLETPSGMVHIEHGQKATARIRTKNLGMSCIQGHRHGEAYAEWWNNSQRAMYGVQAGCLIDNRDLGFWYNRNYRVHPVIGSAVVIDGEPFIVRLNEGKSGAWDGRLALRRAA